MAANNPELQERLRARLVQARNAYSRAQKEFDRAIASVRAGMSSSDGAYLVESTSRARSSAFEEYERSLREFSDYILSGKLPSDSLTENSD